MRKDIEAESVASHDLFILGGVMSILAAALVLSSLAGGPTAPERHVVMISIDGLMPSYYLDADQLGIEAPNLHSG